MNKFAICAAASLMFFGAHAAQAQFSPAGAKTFSGPVTVQKDGAAYSCTLTVNANVAAAGTATATASLSGGFPCGLISVAGTATVTRTIVSPTVTNVTLTGFTIDPPLSPGLCNGPITVRWNGNTASPRSLTASSPLSDSAPTSGAPCKIIGTLNQTAGTALVIN